MDMIEILRETVARQASDLHLTIGRPPVMRIHGELEPQTDYQVLQAEDTESLIMQIISDEQRKELDKQNRMVTQELEEIRRTASSALAIDAENKELKSRIVAYERQAQTLQQENEGLKDRTARDWFMVGAGVVILGMIIGLIIPRIRWRKKSSWDTF